jgi:hypothetical protein
MIVLTLCSVTEQCLQMAGLLRGLRHSANAEDNVKIADILIAVYSSDKATVMPWPDLGSNAFRSKRRHRISDKQQVRTQIRRIMVHRRVGTSVTCTKTKSLAVNLWTFWTKTCIKTSGRVRLASLARTRRSSGCDQLHWHRPKDRPKTEPGHCSIEGAYTHLATTRSAPSATGPMASTLT